MSTQIKTLKEFADLLGHYAKNHPDLAVRFVSNESGGYWPQNTRQPLGVFVDDQVFVCQEGVYDDAEPPTSLTISLMRF